MTRNVLRAAEDVHEINVDRNVDESAKDLLPEYELMSVNSCDEF